MKIKKKIFVKITKFSLINISWFFSFVEFLCYLLIFFKKNFSDTKNLIMYGTDCEMWGWWRLWLEGFSRSKTFDKILRWFLKFYSIFKLYKHILSNCFACRIFYIFYNFINSEFLITKFYHLILSGGFHIFYDFLKFY